jgi:hypothetical protein
VLPLDVYLENENEIVQKAAGGVVEDLKETVGWRLAERDPESRVVVNFHGVSLAGEDGHLGLSLSALSPYAPPNNGSHVWSDSTAKEHIGPQYPDRKS